MASSAFVFPSKIVQAFDHKCGSKGWQISTPEGFAFVSSNCGNIHAKWQIRVLDNSIIRSFREGGCRWIAAAAAESKIATEEECAENSDHVFETQNDLLEFLANAGSLRASETLDRRLYGDSQERNSSTMAPDNKEQKPEEHRIWPTNKDNRILPNKEAPTLQEHGMLTKNVESKVQHHSISVRHEELATQDHRMLAKNEQRKPGACWRLLNEDEVIPGAIFAGIVRSIHSFGAFIDIGTFTDGFLHISQLCEGYVNETQDVICIGQQIRVRILQVSIPGKKLALTMKEVDEERQNIHNPNSTGKGDGAPGAGRWTAGTLLNRKSGEKTKTEFEIGQTVDGVVKTLTRRGAFVVLPSGEEGFLPVFEIPEGQITPLRTILKTGQCVEVRIIKVGGGRLTLSLKPALDLASINKESNSDIDTAGLNQFGLAFRSDPMIRNYLSEMEERKEQGKHICNEAESVEQSEVALKMEEEVITSEGKKLFSLSGMENKSKEGTSSLVKEEVLFAISQGDGCSVKEVVDAKQGTPIIPSVENSLGIAEVSIAEGKLEVQSNYAPSAEEEVSPQRFAGESSEVDCHARISKQLRDVTVNSDSSVSFKEVAARTLGAAQGSAFAAVAAANDINPLSSTILLRILREETGAALMDCKKVLIEMGGDLEKAHNHLVQNGLASAEKRASHMETKGAIGGFIHNSRVGVLIEVMCKIDSVSKGEIVRQLIDDLAMQLAASPHVQYVSVEDVPLQVKKKQVEIELQREDLKSKPEYIRAKIVDGRIAKRLRGLALLEQSFFKDDTILVKDLMKQKAAIVGQIIQIKRFVRLVCGEGFEGKSQNFHAKTAAQIQRQKVLAGGSNNMSTIEHPATAVYPAAGLFNSPLLKQLCEETGASKMQCKKAIIEGGGYLEVARAYLRKHGLVSTGKKASRVLVAGGVGIYIENFRVGVLIEVNCQTDAVSRGDIFKQLLEDLAIQVALSPKVKYVSVQDIPLEIQAKERELELQKKNLNEIEEMKAEIANDRVAKRLGELALFEQVFFKDDSLLVGDLLRQTVVTLGENICVRRFVRYIISEEIENFQQ
uniref:Elongation factor Ts, mitochondrial n=1 Tax=Huperzia serrata TaxID=355589 RepID=A0A481ZIK6_HUPSR|nr:elongation factor Ts family protein [Huperzia serrata]